MIDIATYVVSDIHGEYELFIRLLEEIRLKETDTLYVLGDILDRGSHPIRIILKLMEMPNVVCLTGNHELMALECLEFLMQEITEISIEKVDEKMLENLMTWQYNGSKSTIDTVPIEAEPVWAFIPGLDQSAVDKTTEKWLQKIYDRLDFTEWYAGHYHVESEECGIRIMYENYDEICAKE